MQGVQTYCALSALLFMAFFGAYAGDGGGAAGAGVGRYVEVVDEEGLSKLDPVLMRELVTEKHSDGLTLLHIAAQYFTDDGVNAVRCACYWGADINAQDNRGDTPLHYAAFFGNKSSMAYLCAQGAYITLVNNEGETAYEVFRKRQGKEYTDAEFSRAPLFSRTMIAQAADCFVVSVLPSIVRLSKIRVLLALICGVDFSSITYAGETILHREVGRYLFTEMVREGMGFNLLCRGAESDVPLMNNHPSRDVLGMLIQHGAPLFAKNSAGKTAEQVAREKGFILAADFLAQAGHVSPARLAWMGAVVRRGIGERPEEDIAE